MDLLKIVKYIWYLITLVCLLDLCIRELVHEFKKAAARHMMCLGYILMGFVIDHIHPSPASCAKVPKKVDILHQKTATAILNTFVI